MNSMIQKRFNASRKAQLRVLSAVAVCVGLVAAYGAAAEDGNPLLTVRFANPLYDCASQTYWVDVELQSDTPGQKLFGMNVRFFYEDADLDFVNFTDFQGGYEPISPSPPQVRKGTPNSGPDLFGYSDKAVYVNGAVQLVDYDAPPVTISTTDWTKIFSVCFAVSDPDPLKSGSFCPSIIWDLKEVSTKGGFLSGSSGVVMTVLADAPTQLALANKSAVQFNGRYEKSAAGPYVSPMSSTCIAVDCKNSQPTKEELESIAEQLLNLFEQADDNSDGQLTYAEALSVLPGLTQAQFDALDLDGDGALTKEELRRAISGGGRCGCVRRGNLMEAKDLLGSWLLIGLSGLILLTTARIQKR